MLENAKPVTVEWKNVTLETALNDVFKEQPLTWSLEDKTITIIKRAVPVSKTDKLHSQPPPPIHIKGIITDMDGTPINGVSVVIYNTKKGTASNDAGRFSIDAYQKDLLVFSSINYITKEVKVEGSDMNIKMQLDIKPMEAMLVGGNLTPMKRRTLHPFAIIKTGAGCKVDSSLAKPGFFGKNLYNASITSCAV